MTYVLYHVRQYLVRANTEENLSLAISLKNIIFL